MTYHLVLENAPQTRIAVLATKLVLLHNLMKLKMCVFVVVPISLEVQMYFSPMKAACGLQIWTDVSVSISPFLSKDTFQIYKGCHHFYWLGTHSDWRVDGGVDFHEFCFLLANLNLVSTEVIAKNKINLFFQLVRGVSLVFFLKTITIFRILQST